MNWRLTLIVLGLLWAGALAWLFSSWDGEPADPVDRPGPEVVLDEQAGTEPKAAPQAEPSRPELPQPEAPQPEFPQAGSPQSAAPNPGDSVLEAPVPVPSEPDPVVQVEDSQELDPTPAQRKVFEKIFDPIEKASERYERHGELDKSSWFGEDQKSNSKAIDRLLDEAVKVLEISDLSDVRERLRGIDSRIEELRQEIAGHREKRLAAPREDELGTIGKATTTSVEDLDRRIEDAEVEISERERERLTLENDFVRGLEDLGLEVDLETARHLLGTVSGDDFLDLCIAFDNVRVVTEQLRVLTENAGESLDLARKYYGSYVVLIRILDRVQKEFVRRVEEEQVPKLAEFAARARENIRQAEANRAAGGDPQIAIQNIRSNELTEQACEFYTRYLLEQAGDVAAQNEALQIKLRDAENTFDTVQLSSQVAELLKEGQRNFSALLELEVPKLRGFENAELQLEFERLTRELVQP